MGIEIKLQGSDGLMDKVPASHLEPHTGHDHDSSYGISTGWFQEADTRVINISWKNLFHNRAKINMFKLIKLQSPYSESTTFIDNTIIL